MKTSLCLVIAAGFLSGGLFVSTGLAQQRRGPVAATPDEIAAAKAAVEAAPDSAEAHDAYIKDVRDLETKVSQYEAWEKQFPKSAEVAYKLGSVLGGAEDPRAKPQLLKAIELGLDPKQSGEAYQALAFDAERWGSEGAFREYMRQATLVQPDNPDYAFYYTFSYRETTPADHAKWEAMTPDFAKRFADSWRGAQALYWLGSDVKTDQQKIAAYESLRKQFPPGDPKFRGWSADGMQGLFDAYLRTDSAKAVSLAADMQGTMKGKEADDWGKKAEFAKNYGEVRALLAAGKASDALALLDKIPADRRFGNEAMMFRLRAEVTAAAGDAQDAYDNLVGRLVASPEGETRDLAVRLGAGLGRTAAQVDADIWAKTTAAAKAAPKFDLAMYTADKNLSLDDLHGKVVLLTFWFPGCGPCRGEFPHFESVLDKFRGRNVAYVGINVTKAQDDYVVPFMAGTKYTFIPLHGLPSTIAKDAYNVHGEPTNFLIDQSGRIVYTNFRADASGGEEMLQRMIETLLAHPSGA